MGAAFRPGNGRLSDQRRRLFYVMMQSIQHNNFELPAFVQYNGLDIPFAYPPFGLYVGALLSSLFDIDLLKIVQWLPAITLILTIPAFYLLSKAILVSNFKAGIATAIFALTPRSMTWPIMGGGVTRSFGYLFLLLTLTSVYLLFAKREKKYLVLSILFSTLTVLSHPEAALQTVGLCLLIWIFKGRDKTGILNAIYVGLGTMILSAIWWLPVLIRFGLDPLLAAAQTGSHSALAILYPIFAVLTDEPLMKIVAVFGLIGLAISLARKDYLIPSLYLLPFLVEPRSAATYSVIGLAMLSATTLTETILPVLEKSGRRWAYGFLAAIGLYLLGSAMYFDAQLAGTRVSPANREAFEWIKSNTPEQSRFLVLTGDNEIFCDGVSEWFPALARRVSVTTIQGNEWLTGKYADAASAQLMVQSCLSANDSLACVEKATAQANRQYDFIYAARQSSIKSLCRVVATSPRGEFAAGQYSQDQHYRLVYRMGEVSIFAVEH